MRHDCCCCCCCLPSDDSGEVWVGDISCSSPSSVSEAVGKVITGKVQIIISNPHRLRQLLPRWPPSPMHLPRKTSVLVAFREEKRNYTFFPTNDDDEQIGSEAAMTDSNNIPMIWSMDMIWPSHPSTYSSDRLTIVIISRDEKVMISIRLYYCPAAAIFL